MSGILRRMRTRWRAIRGTGRRGLRERLKLRVDSTGDLEVDAGLFWAESQRNDSVRDLSHWRGVGRWNDDRWFAEGDLNWSIVRRFLQQEAPAEFLASLSERSALEWGPGGGANARLLCQQFRSVVGIDISKRNLDECVSEMARQSYTNFTPVLISATDPERVLEQLPANSIDLALSTAVFQHFPSKNYTQRVLVILDTLLSDAGFAMIQVRYPDGSEKFSQKHSDYFDNAIRMTSFETREFRELAQQAGLRVVHSETDLDGGHAHYEYHLLRRA